MGVEMKKIALAVALSMLGAGTSLAADMAVKAPPPPAPVYSWTGCYIGLDAGGFGALQSAIAVPGPSPGFGAPAVGGTGILGFPKTN